MSRFLEKIEEYKAPVMRPKAEDNVSPGAKPRGPGLMASVASGLQKVKKAADVIKTVGTGEWSIDNLLDGIVKAGMDKQSGKLTMFGKPGHNQVMLGQAYIDTIKQRSSENPEVKDTEKVDVKKSTETGKVETQKEGFISVIDDLIFEVTKAEGDKIRAKAKKLDIPIKTPSGKPIGPARLQGRIERKLEELKKDQQQGKLDLTDEDKPKETDSTKETKDKKEEQKSKDGKGEATPIGDTRSAASRVAGVLKRALKQMPIKIDFSSPQSIRNHPTVQYITKNPKNFLKLVQEEYPNIKFTYDGGKGFSRVEKTEKDKKTENAETKPELSDEDKAVIASKGRPFVKSLGEANAERVVRGLVDIYPGRKIEFEEPEKKPEPKEKDEKTPEEDAPEQDILTSSTKFELVNGKDYGEDRQFTLKADDFKVTEYLSKKGIKHITYLQKPKPRTLLGGKGGQIGSNMELSSSSKGQLIAYDTEDQPISELNVEAPFEWNSNQKAYSLSRDNTVKLGPDAAKGEMGFPADSPQIYFSDPNRKYIVLVKDAAAADKALAGGEKIFLGGDFRADFDKNQFKKYGIVRTDEEGDFVVNVRQPLPLAPADARAIQKFKSSVAASVRAGGGGAAVGKGATQTTTPGKTKLKPGVKKDVQMGQTVLTDPKTGKPITGERGASQPKIKSSSAKKPTENEEEKIASKYLEKIEEYL